jgi:N-methylhydantoinase A
MSGGVALDAAAARQAMSRLASSLRESEAKTARAIIATADATMARALRRVSVERGIDPRECVLIAFGGGGPLHACGLAELLGVTRIVVPPHAGVLSALGLAMTPERREAMTSVMLPLSDWSDADRSERSAALGQGMPAHLKRRTVVLRVRFTGQGHELDVPIRAGQSALAIAKSFLALHQARYGFTLAAPIEVVSMRLVAEGDGRSAKIAGGKPAGKRSRGPVSVALPDATLWIGKGWAGRPLPRGGWLLEQA